MPVYAGCVYADFWPVRRTRFLGDRYHYFFIGKRLRTKATNKFYISDVFCLGNLFYPIFYVGKQRWKQNNLGLKMEKGFKPPHNAIFSDSTVIISMKIWDNLAYT